LLRLTKQTDYGIVLLTLFAGGAPERPQSANELARMTNLPQPMVGKILKLLARAGLLESQRGAHGGYRLSREPGEISVAEIIRALEGPIAITQCLESGGPGRDCSANCMLSPNWRRINQALRDALERVSLREMMQRGAEE